MKIIYKYILIFIVGFVSCRKNRIPCDEEYNLPKSPYSNPVWYFDDQQLGFNYTPLAGASTVNLCDDIHLPVYTYKEDSAGFWMINRDGTHLRRLINFQLQNPAWSPDGKWIAFSKDHNIYKMPFDGHQFDTTNIIALTTDSLANSHPTWTLTSDTIFYDSQKDAPSYVDNYIWKMDADGKTKTMVKPPAPDVNFDAPFYTTTNHVLFIGYINEYAQVFSMQPDGSNVTQITYDAVSIGNGNGNVKYNPRYFNTKIFYESSGIWRTDLNGNNMQKLTDKSVEGFSISKDGIIAYVNFDYSEINNIYGTVWLMNADGTNKKQLTFNKL